MDAVEFNQQLGQRRISVFDGHGNRRDLALGNRWKIAPKLSQLVFQRACFMRAAQTRKCSSFVAERFAQVIKIRARPPGMFGARSPEPVERGLVQSLIPKNESVRSVSLR